MTKVHNTQMRIENNAPLPHPALIIRPKDTEVGGMIQWLPPGAVVKDVYRNGLLLTEPDDFVIDLSKQQIVFVEANAFQLGDIFVIKFSN